MAFYEKKPPSFQSVFQRRALGSEVTALMNSLSVFEDDSLEKKLFQKTNLNPISSAVCGNTQTVDTGWSAISRRIHFHASQGSDYSMRGYLTLGILVGLLVGMTRASVVGAVIPLLLAFSGGTAIAFFAKQSAEIRKIAERNIFGLSAGAIAGVVLGIVVSDNRLLTFRAYQQDAVAKEAAHSRETYLFNNRIKSVQAVEQKLGNGRLTLEQAYEELKKICSQE
jgi:hypothetical protein